MYDLLDMLHGKANYIMTGCYFPHMPYSPEDEHSMFDYEHVYVTEWHYQKLFGNLINTDGATATIRTNDDLGAKIGQFISLQDEKLYKISSVMKDYQSTNKEAFRFLKDVPQIDYIIRLVEIDNPWGIQ